MSEPKITCEIDQDGRITIKGGVLLSKDEADRIAAHIESQRRRIAELEQLICDMWAGIVREHPQGGFPDMGLMEKRMRDMGIEVVA